MVRLLGRGIDTLVVGFHVALAAPGDLTLWDNLRELKDRAQTGEKPSLQFGGSTFEVQPHGAGQVYAWCLKNADFTVGISRRSPEDTPTLAFQPSCAFLWEHGLEATWLAAQDVAQAVDVNGARPRATLSRIDLAADFQGIDFGSASVEDFVSRARTSENRVNLERPTRKKRRDLPTLEAAEYRSGVEVTGFAFGVSPIRVRVYDKTREIKANGNVKDWFPKRVWQGFDKSAPVWRVEVQLSREVLKEIKVRRVYGRDFVGPGEGAPLDTLDGVKASLDAWWRYALGLDAKDGTPGESGWISWRVPGSDKTRARWRARDEWSAVRGVSFEKTEGYVGVRKRSREAKAEQVERMALGCMTSAAALRGRSTVDDLIDLFCLAIGREYAQAEGPDEMRREVVEAVRKKAIRLNTEHPLLRDPLAAPDARELVDAYNAAATHV